MWPMITGIVNIGSVWQFVVTWIANLIPGAIAGSGVKAISIAVPSSVMWGCREAWDETAFKSLTDFGALMKTMRSVAGLRSSKNSRDLSSIMILSMAHLTCATNGCFNPLESWYQRVKPDVNWPRRPRRSAMQCIVVDWCGVSTRFMISATVHPQFVSQRSMLIVSELLLKTENMWSIVESGATVPASRMGWSILINSLGVVLICHAV